MSEATGTKTEKKSIVQNLRERDTLLLDMKLSLEEFAGLVTVRYDERWRWHDWRVQGDERLCYWIYDHIDHNKVESSKVPDEKVIEYAYERFRYIQARQGQMNFHSVYVRDVEEIDVIPPKNFNYVKVSVVKDCLDNLYRYSTTFSIAGSGSGSAPSFRSDTTETRIDAVLNGAREVYTALSKSWQAELEAAKYNPFINKIREFIESVEDQIKQPSLFG